MTVPPAVRSTRPWRSWRERSQVQWVDTYTRISLYGVLAIFPFVSALILLTGGADVAGVLALALVVVQAALSFWLLRRTMQRYPHGYLHGRREWVTVAAGGLIVAVGAVLPLSPDHRAAVVIGTLYCVCLAVSPLLRGHAIWAVTLAGAVVFTAVRWDAADADGWFGTVWLTGFLLLMLYTYRLSLWLLAVVRELDQARATQSALAVAEERLRFSRDLHDVVGRALSSIAVKSELAAELGRRGDDRAPAQMLQVRAIAQESLHDMRTLVRSYRNVDLATEIAGARALLNAAGIDCAVTGDPGQLSPGQQEAAAWVVREAVTNVLRHSSASRCRITLEGLVLTISNDGVQPGGDGRASALTRAGTDTATDTGTGLVGLRERLAPVGGSLTVGSRPPDRFVVTVTLPGASVS